MKRRRRGAFFLDATIHAARTVDEAGIWQSSLAALASNMKVGGGGAYFIISRSFGSTIGGAIGISLYLSQAISVAFYMIAFAEAFSPLAPAFQEAVGIAFDPRLVSLPATVALVALTLTRGADLGVKALWGVAVILFVSLAMFFLGSPPDEIRPETVHLVSDLPGAHPFMLVFAICFPAFTGMTAGVGLSGDLANPRRLIPLGILSATLVGMVVYMFVVVKLAASATPEALATDQLIMSRIAVWGPIIPIGLAAATLSSAIGSILVAPRTLQALGGDGIIPARGLNRFLAEGRGRANEPYNATIITSAGNQGWPYCMGNRQPYRDRSNTDATVLTGWYDCDNLRNTSPRNTGLVDIPPARDNMIWYSPQGGGPVYPTRTDGSGLPSYVTGQETFTRPYLRGGSQAVMNGPTYQRSEVDTDSGVAWPAYWNDKWFIGDFSNPNNRVAVTVDPATVVLLRNDIAPLMQWVAIRGEALGLFQKIGEPDAAGIHRILQLFQGVAAFGEQHVEKLL